MNSSTVSWCGCRQYKLLCYSDFAKKRTANRRNSTVNALHTLAPWSCWPVNRIADDVTSTISWWPRTDASPVNRRPTSTTSTPMSTRIRRPPPTSCSGTPPADRDQTVTESLRVSVYQHRFGSSGVARNLFRRGEEKRVGSVTSGIHTDTEPPVGSGAKPPKQEKCTEKLIECHKFHTGQTKKFFSVAISEGGHVPLSLRFPTPLFGL